MGDGRRKGRQQDFLCGRNWEHSIVFYGEGGGGAALTNAVWAEPCIKLIKVFPRIWNIIPNFWETLSKNLKLSEISTSLLHVSQRISQVPRFPGKPSDSQKNFQIVFLPKQPFLELTLPLFWNRNSKEEGTTTERVGAKIGGSGPLSSHLLVKHLMSRSNHFNHLIDLGILLFIYYMAAIVRALWLVN